MNDTIPIFSEAITRDKKKVLLRERRGHTAHLVSSTLSPVLSWVGGYPILGQGVPTTGWGYPMPGRGTPSNLAEVPPSRPDWGTPDLDLARCLPSGPGWGTALEGTWDQSLGYPPERTWGQWKYYEMEMGYHSLYEQTDACKNSTFPAVKNTYFSHQQDLAELFVDMKT